MSVKAKTFPRTPAENMIQDVMIVRFSKDASTGGAGVRVVVISEMF